MTVDATFVSMIDRNLSYFKDLIESDDVSFEILNGHQEGLRRSIQFGAKSSQTNAKAADLFISSFTFIQQQGNYQPWAQTAIRLANRFEKNDQYLLTRVVSLLGVLQQEIGHTKKAEQAFRSAERLALENEDTAAVANAWYYLGVLEHRKYRSEQASGYLDRAKGLFETELDLNDKDNKIVYGFVLNLLGLIAQQRQFFDEAEDLLNQAERVFEDLDAEHFSTMIDINQAYLYAAKGDIGRAENRLRTVATSSLEQGLLLRHADAAITLSDIYFAQQRWQESYDIVDQIKIVELQKRGHIRYVASVKNNLGNSLTQLGDFDAALMFLHDALPLWKQLRDDVQYANSYGSIGHAFAGKGETQKAQQHYENALSLLRSFDDETRVKKVIEEFEQSLQMIV